MSKKGKMTVFGAASLGVGSMVGAGIFALMGEAGSIAGSATYLSFLMGGIIALSSGYSYSKLGVKFPTSGGVIEYLYRGYYNNVLSGTFSIMFLVAQIITMAMVAKTFGSYAAGFFDDSTWIDNACTSGVILLFTMINFIGSDIVSKSETVIVGIKLTILLAFMVAGFSFVDTSHFAASTYPASSSIFGSLAITYFAYTGFAVITNTASSLENPTQQLPKAIMLAIGFTVFLYIGLSVVVFGNLTVDQVIEYKETALAEAAKPIFGAVGFTIMSIAALLSTASSLNANLFSSLNMTENEAEYGEITPVFMKAVWKKGTDGLLIIAALILLMANFMNLNEIASLGSIATLLVTMMVHVGHLNIIDKTKANKPLVVAAIVLNALAVILFFWYSLDQGNYKLIIEILLLIIVCFIYETYMHGRYSTKKPKQP